jgi:hypothetical protein
MTLKLTIHGGGRSRCRKRQLVDAVAVFRLA